MWNTVVLHSVHFFDWDKIIQSVRLGRSLRLSPSIMQTKRTETNPSNIGTTTHSACKIWTGVTYVYLSSFTKHVSCVRCTDLWRGQLWQQLSPGSSVSTVTTIWVQTPRNLFLFSCDSTTLEKKYVLFSYVYFKQRRVLRHIHKFF